jgi:hypothetical protein
MGHVRGGGTNRCHGRGISGTTGSATAIMVPTYGEVGWYIEDEWHAVWKATVAAYQIQLRG